MCKKYADRKKGDASVCVCVLRIKQNVAPYIQCTFHIDFTEIAAKEEQEEEEEEEVKPGWHYEFPKGSRRQGLGIHATQNPITICIENMPFFFCRFSLPFTTAPCDL